MVHTNPKRQRRRLIRTQSASKAFGSKPRLHFGFVGTAACRPGLMGQPLSGSIDALQFLRQNRYAEVARLNALNDAQLQNLHDFFHHRT